MTQNQEKKPTKPGQSGLALVVCLSLAAAIWVVFGQTLGFEFVNIDDTVYVSENPLVSQGVTLDGMVVAFTTTCFDNWTPLTTISHMVDCQFYGLTAGGHHLTNVILHSAAAILLFLILRQMTSALWPSAFVAALFALHPLRAESVAWVSERKDVLSGVFFMLTIGAYVRYVRLPWSPRRYLAVAVLFALGLLAKPMLVTLPLILLLLDYWPLNRFAPEAGTVHGQLREKILISRRLIVEKIPLCALSLAACVLTVVAEKKSELALAATPVSLRIGNALVSYVTHIGRMFWPARLAAFYPYPEHGLPTGEIILAGLLLAGISAGAFLLRHKFPFVLVGWLWYLIMLLPVIGLMQVGLQARADRHTYLPQIGLYLLLAWTATKWSAGRPNRHRFLGAGSLIVLVLLIICARAQTAGWRNSDSLWEHTLACTDDNCLAQYEVGASLFAKGKSEEAISRFRKALEINPNYARVYLTLGDIYALKGQMQKALPNYLKAAENSSDVFELIDKNRPFEVLNNLAWLFATSPDSQVRNATHAVELAEHACELTHYQTTVCLGTLAAAYAEAGRFDDAIATAQLACGLAEKSRDAGLLQKNRQLLELYRAHKPYREGPEKPIPTNP